MLLRFPAPPHAVAVALLGAFLGGLAVLGHDGHRAAQVLLLSVPALVWMCWPLDRPAWRRTRAAFVVATLLGFSFDAVVRDYLARQYQAAPDSALVIAAVANTSWPEVEEYLAQQARPLLLGSAALLVAMPLFIWLGRSALNPPAPPRRTRGLLIALLVLGGIGYAVKPWRKHHPLLFWPGWFGDVAAFRTTLADRQAVRERLLHNAREAAPTVASGAPSTVVLVLTDSVNRDNMSLYGYARRTTPQLEALAASLGDRLAVLPHAWSTEPGTLASLGRLFGFGRAHEDLDAPDAQHLLALARAAGYRVSWISNHSDIGIEQQHALLADETLTINRQPGRSSTMLDGELLDELQQALAQPEARKLIVVHLLGTHPHYRLRRPDNLELPGHEGDSVDRQMTAAGRPAWLRAARREYDAAMRYHDAVVAETLRLTLRLSPEQQPAAWMYLSDHGQEVGHERNHAGHSPTTAAGYRIPALVWRSEPSKALTTAPMPLRADWAAWTVAGLMHLRWPGAQPERDVLHPDYRWEPPALPVTVPRFDR